MKIDAALNEFDSQRAQKFSPQDLAKIRQVVDELGLVDFSLKFRDDKTEATYVFDTRGDVLHIHSTMLVSSQAFTGATDRNKKPYKSHRYHFPLSRWKRS